MSEKDSRAAKFIGLALAGTGLAHFANPTLFESITAPAFPDNTRQAVYTNGGIETVLGLGLAARKTRRLATFGVLGYLAYLAGNAVRSR